MKAILSTVLVLCLTLFCGCCNFYSMDGNGSCPLAVWEDYLPVVTTQELDQIKSESGASDVTLLFDRGAYGGYKTKISRGFQWGIPAGPYRERSFWTPDRTKAGRTLCMKLDSWGTTILPFMAGNAEVYNYPRGECLAYQRFMRFGIIPLVAYESSLMPVVEGELVPGCPNVMAPGSLCWFSVPLEGVKPDKMNQCCFWPTSSLRQMKYDRLTSYYFLCGMLAFGQKNERAYMQIAWIPIPLWSMEE
jgi:hypothetical protein